MRIVSFEEFLKLPRGTVFALYEPEVIGDIRIKVGNFSDWDYQYDPLDMLEAGLGIPDLGDLHRDGGDVPLDFNYTSREGSTVMDKGQLFAVWSKVDVRAFITRLEESLQEVERDVQDNAT
ncbi:hypothetical protein D3C85_552900 [compost metagenome]